MSGATRTRALVGLLLVLAVVAGYAPAFDAAFVNWDDEAHLVQNQDFRGLDAEHLGWMLRTGHLGPYQPLAWWTLAVDHALWGLDAGLSPPQAGRFHATSVLLQALAALFAWALAEVVLRRARPDGGERARTWCAGFAALVFAVHPMRVESVAWITERRDVVSGALFLAAAYAYARTLGARTGARLVPRAAGLALAAAGTAAGLALVSIDFGRAGELGLRGAGAAGLGAAFVLWAVSIVAGPRASGGGGASGAALVALLFFASLLGKGLAVVLPPMLLVLDACVLGRWTRPRLQSAAALVAEKAPLFALALVFGRIATWGQAGLPEAVVDWESHTLVERLVQVPYALAFYATRTLVPVGLGPMHELPDTLSILEPRFALAALFVAAASVLAWRRARRWPAVAGAWLAYVLAVLPVSGISQTGPQLVADRYGYLPAIPLALLAGGALGAIVARRGPRAGAGIGALCSLALVAATYRQTGFWTDSEHLWARAEALAPESAYPPLLLGKLRLAEARGAPAEERRALLEEADRLHRVGLARDPSPPVAYLVNHAAVLLQLGRAEEAERVLERCVAARPDHAIAHANLATARMLLGRPADALPSAERATVLDAEYPRGWEVLGRALEALERREEAVRAYRRALRLWPNYGPVRQRLQALGAAPEPSSP